MYLIVSKKRHPNKYKVGPMLDPKLLLARSITLLYRESLLDNHNDSSVEMVRNVLKDIHTSDNGIGLSEDKKIISGLKNTVLNLCDNYKEAFDPRDLVQQVTIACESDTKLLEAIKTAIEADYNESSLKKSCSRKQSSFRGMFFSADNS